MRTRSGGASRDTLPVRAWRTKPQRHLLFIESRLLWNFAVSECCLRGRDYGLRSYANCNYYLLNKNAICGGGGRQLECGVRGDKYFRPQYEQVQTKKWQLLERGSCLRLACRVNVNGRLYGAVSIRKTWQSTDSPRGKVEGGCQSPVILGILTSVTLNIAPLPPLLRR